MCSILSVLILSRYGCDYVDISKACVNLSVYESLENIYREEMLSVYYSVVT